jgi:hypothetical protein
MLVVSMDEQSVQVIAETDVQTSKKTGKKKVFLSK